MLNKQEGNTGTSVRWRCFHSEWTHQRFRNMYSLREATLERNALPWPRQHDFKILEPWSLPDPSMSAQATYSVSQGCFLLSEIRLPQTTPGSGKKRPKFKRTDWEPLYLAVEAALTVISPKILLLFGIALNKQNQ